VEKLFKMYDSDLKIVLPITSRSKRGPGVWARKAT